MIPREECLKLLEKHEVPEHIKRHSAKVEEVAVYLAQKLLEAGEQVDTDLVSRSALLHDIDKAKTLEAGEGHGKVSKKILEEEGLPKIAEIALRHHLSQILEKKPFETLEQKIVYYADKRINHDQIVSLEERFKYLLERYGKRSEIAEKILACKPKAKALEREIFSKIKADKTLSELQ